LIFFNFVVGLLVAMLALYNTIEALRVTPWGWLLSNAVFRGLEFLSAVLLLYAIAKKKPKSGSGDSNTELNRTSSANEVSLHMSDLERTSSSSIVLPSNSN
jgi:hypothetical protein